MEMVPILTGEPGIVFKNLGREKGVRLAAPLKIKWLAAIMDNSNVDQTIRQWPQPPLCGLLVTQRFDRIHACRLASRDIAEHDTDRR